MSRIVSTKCLDFSAKKEAFNYQAQTFAALKDLDYAAIFLEQGLGKTKVAIDLALYWLTQRDIDTVLIVTKKQLVKNWIEEFEFHSHLKPRVLSNDRKNNFYVLNSTSKIVITNFETISTEYERIKLFLKCRDVALVIDESTKLKNPESKLTLDYFSLSDFFKIKVIMTGTPIANRPYDIWAQIFFLDKGRSLGSDFKAFKKNTDLSNKFAFDEEASAEFEDAVSGIFDKIKDFSVRETKKSSGIELPQKIIETVYADFESNQYYLYDTVLKELEVEVEQDGQLITDDDSASLKRLLRLVQIASNPRLVDDAYDGISGKEVELDKLLKDIISKGEKCIVWSSYINNIDYFALKYAHYGTCRIHGGLDMSVRNAAVDAFKTDPDCRVLFATPQAAKEGLTLTVANNVIFYDRTFNLDDYLQAQDRIHRISQKKICHVYNLLMRDSIDIWVDRLIEAKYRAALLAQGDIDISEYTDIADYSYGDLIREVLNVEGVRNG